MQKSSIIDIWNGPKHIFIVVRILLIVVLIVIQFLLVQFSSGTCLVCSCLYFSSHKKMKFSLKNFLSKCEQIRRKLWIYSHLLKKSFTESFIFLWTVSLGATEHVISTLICVLSLYFRFSSCLAIGDEVWSDFEENPWNV